MVVLDAATIHESLAQKAACSLESVDASYSNKVGAGQEPDLSPDLEKQTYSEKRKFWEDISRKRASYQRSESEISRTSQLTFHESDSESCLPNVVSEGDGTTEGISDVMRSETIDDMNVPDISECSVAEKAHYFEEQIQKEMAKSTPRLHQQDSAKSEKDRLHRGKSIEDQKARLEQSAMETIDVEEKHVAESREIEKTLKTTEDVKWTKEMRKELKDKDKDKKEKDTDESKEVREEIKTLITQPMEVCKEMLNREREFAEESQMRRTKAEKVEKETNVIRREAVREIEETEKMEQIMEVKTIPEETKAREVEVCSEKIERKPEITTQIKPDVSADERLSKEIVQEKLPGRQIIREETTIVYKMQKDGTLSQEQVLKSVQIEGTDARVVTQVPQVSMETKITDVKGKPISSEIDEFFKGEKGMIEETERRTKIEREKSKDELPKTEASTLLQREEEAAKQEADTILGKEKRFTIDTEVKHLKKESRIPISMAKAEKDKSQKDTKVKSSQEKLSDERPIRSPISEREKDVASPHGKKKEFESRIPKRVVEGATIREKDLPGRKDGETITVTEKKSSEEVTSRHEERSTTKSKTFSKTFTDIQDAFKIFEDMGAIKDKDFATVTSKVDTKATSKLEKKEVVSSEITSGADKFITHEEKEKVERKKSSESKLTKESPDETLEEKRRKCEEVDKTAVQKMSMDLREGKEVIDASASESRAESKKEELFKLLEDKEGTATQESGTSRIRESDVDVAIRIKRDDTKKVEDTTESPRASAEKTRLGKVEMIAQGQSYKESKDSFKVEQYMPSEKAKAGEKADLTKRSGKYEKTPSEESLEKRQRSIAKKIEARNIAEDLIQSIESEIERRSSTSEVKEAQALGKEYLDQLMSESSDTDHEKLADDLTKKFQSIMKKSLDEQITEGKVEDRPIADTTLRKASILEETFERGSNRDSISISEDITKDEESSLRDDREESLPLSSAHARLQDRDITMSPSSISEQIDLEGTIDVDTNELEDISKQASSLQSEKLRSDRSSSHIEPLQRDLYSDTSLSRDKIVSEISGARVLEILEPSLESRQDSVDVPSLELDEYKISEPTSRDVASLHESAAVDSLEKIMLERDVTISSSTVSEGAEYPRIHEQRTSTVQPRDAGTRRADSFEIESPPLISPRMKVRDLEIQPVNWMIGDEKIEISETLQPSQVFNQELDEYERRTRTSSQDDSATDLEQESVTKSSEDISVIESVKEPVTVGDEADTTILPTSKTTKFTVVPVSESDMDSELREDKLDVTCQELMDTLQRQYDATTPTDDKYAAGIRQSVPREDFDLEASITEAVTEVIPAKEEEAKDLTEDVFAEIVKVESDVEEERSLQRDISTTQVESAESTDVGRISAEKEIATRQIVTEEAEQKQPETDKTAQEPEATRKGVIEIQREEVGTKSTKVDDVLKEWTETYRPKIRSEEYKRHMEKTSEKHDKPGKSTTTSSDTCAFKIKKDDLQSVDLSARYAITVLDQVVKKEIAEVKESLEAAKQDLIEELSENSETMIQIKDSPSEFQFKLQPESIPNDLPFLYKPPSIEHVPVEAEAEIETEGARNESLITELEEFEREPKQAQDTVVEEKVIVAEETAIVRDGPEAVKPPEIDVEKHEAETVIAVQEEQREYDEEDRPSPLPASISGSDVDNRDDSYSLAPPQPAPRRRQKPARISKRSKTSESEAGSSSGESSNYQSCDYDGSGSRPGSSDIEALQSAGVQSGTLSEYETAMMSIEQSGSKPTSQEYQTAATTLSSRESMKSLNSFSSGHLGSIDSTSELSETLVPSDAEADKDEIDENLESALDAEQEAEASDSSGSEDIPMDETVDKIDSHIPCRMKRSSEMIFQQIMDDSVSMGTESMDEGLEEDAKGVDSATSAFTEAPGILQSVDIMTSRVSEDGVQSVCTQVISTRVTGPSDSEELEEEEETRDVEERKETEGRGAGTTDVETSENLEQRSGGVEAEEEEGGGGLDPMQTSVHSMMQQASMSLSSTSGMSFDTVVERYSPDSDSFELVDKPDIMDDFVVIEEVGREAEEFDAEGKSIRISSVPQVAGKNYDRDLENMMTEKNKKKEEEVDSQVSAGQTSKTNDLFELEVEESPPQASNDSQSYSDEEQYEGGKKWIEMQFHADARVYDIEYDRGPLEDIKEEEVTDFEAGSSSRFGSLGSHKESIGSVGSMRGSFGSTPDYDMLASKKYFKPTDHETASLTSLQEFEHLESTLASENSRRQHSGSQDSSSNNGSLPKRYTTGRSGHGDDVSLSSLKDFEGLEKACREAHLIEIRAREEEDLLEHESPESKYKVENLPRSRAETSAPGSFNPSTSGSDDYEKRIKEIDEIIRIAQSNVEKLDRQDDTTEDISQIEITDAERATTQSIPRTLREEVEPGGEEEVPKEGNIMETSTDSLELEDNAEKKYHPLCRSSDSLEMKTTLDYPSLSSDSLNNVKDTRETPSDAAGQFGARRISSDSLEMPLLEQQQEVGASGRSSDSNGRRVEETTIDDSTRQTTSMEAKVRNGKTKTSSGSGT